MGLTARDIMEAKVVCIREDATVEDALEFFLQSRLPGVLVLDATGYLIGTLTILDVMEVVEPMGCEEDALMVAAGLTDIGEEDAGMEVYKRDIRDFGTPEEITGARLEEIEDETCGFLGPEVMDLKVREVMSKTLISAEGGGGWVAVRPTDRQGDCRRGR